MVEEETVTMIEVISIKRNCESALNSLEEALDKCNMTDVVIAMEDFIARQGDLWEVIDEIKTPYITPDGETYGRSELADKYYGPVVHRYQGLVGKAVKCKCQKEG